ncbi:MAG: hypothetical protein K2X39_09510 [Silvanigrellaceae bacterium]|nr:hypothetical protein [Silvanigrellaceae bacterium]
MKIALKRGSLISYSASTTRNDPWGFRVVKNDHSLFKSLIVKYPEIQQQMITDKPTLLINCYPAPIPHFELGISVETYLSKKIAHRALKLAEEVELPTILAGQPLFLAEIIFSYLEKENSFPKKILISTGGYEMPDSLEYVLKEKLSPYSSYLRILHGYGTAEVALSCLIATERNKDKHLIYFPRSEEFKINIHDNKLFLSYVDSTGKYIIENFNTGDEIFSYENGFIIKNEARFSEKARQEFSTWTTNDWERKTGYLSFDEKTIFQLRKHKQPLHKNEMNYFQFMEKTDFEWLNKPHWGIPS